MSEVQSNNGHLPSNKIERTIMDAVDGFEDDDGRVVGAGAFRATPDGPEKIAYAPEARNTGPKGVIADARQHKARAQLQRTADAVRREEMLRARQVKVAPHAAAEASEDDESEDEEDEAYRAYRAQRLQQVQQQVATLAHLPAHGTLDFVDKFEYIDIVDAAHPDAFVVVHLYEDFLPACVRLNFRLQELAAKHDQVRFLAVVASDAKEALNKATLPLLIAYRAGEYVQSVTRAHEAAGATDSGDELPAAALEALLTSRLGVRLTASTAMKAADQEFLSRYREEADDDEGSDDDERSDDEGR